MPKRLPQKLRTVSRKTYYTCIIGVLLLYLLSVWFHYYEDLIAQREFNLIKHPVYSEVIKQVDNRLELTSNNTKDVLQEYYASELKRVGWVFSYEGEIPEYTGGKAVHMTGRKIHYYIYVKDKYQLNLSWLIDSNGKYSNSYSIKISR